MGVTVASVDTDFTVPTNEYDGKVVYGVARTGDGALQNSHAVEMAGAAKDLAQLERQVQLNYLKIYAKPVH